jgi:hypothetical protein
LQNRLDELQIELDKLGEFDQQEVNKPLDKKEIIEKIEKLREEIKKTEGNSLIKNELNFNNSCKFCSANSNYLSSFNEIKNKIKTRDIDHLNYILLLQEKKDSEQKLAKLSNKQQKIEEVKSNLQELDELSKQ